MDCGREGGNVVQILTGPQSKGAGENWGSGSAEHGVWASEDEYGAWNREASVETTSNTNYDGKQSQTRSGSEPPNKKRNSQSVDGRSKAIGKMFFKTKLCCKFRAGACPYITNCNFAHSTEELRRPPPNWQEIVAAHEEEKAVSEPREEFQIPSIESSVGADTPRSYKGRHCKKFYTEEGCSYGDGCTFLHDEHSKARESVAISLGPGTGGGYGGGGTVSNVKPSNWKTRICNKWELTGYCPFRNKCHFAHGSQELHCYGGGPTETEGRDAMTATPDVKQGVMPLKASADHPIVSSVASAPQSDGYHIGAPAPRLSIVIQRTGPRTLQKWKGPDKISLIYGDWIDDIESN